MSPFVLFSIIFLGVVGLVIYLADKGSSPPPGPPAPDVAKAMQIVWGQVYKQAAAAPTVQWIVGSALNCANGMGWHAPGSLEGECVAGLSWPDTKLSQVAWPPNIKISVSAFAHELCHQYLAIIGQPDPNHTGPAFASGGIKDQANAALVAAGL
jgi:hypothetical protein